MSRDYNGLTCGQNMGHASNDNFGGAVDDLDESIKGRGFFSQAFPTVKRHHADVPC